MGPPYAHSCRLNNHSRGAHHHLSRSLQDQMEEGSKQTRASAAACARMDGERDQLVKASDTWQAEAQKLAADLARYKDCTGKSAAELEQLSTKALALEVSLSALVLACLHHPPWAAFLITHLPSLDLFQELLCCHPICRTTTWHRQRSSAPSPNKYRWHEPSCR